ncbi:energy-coupling factor transporter transmembrane component T family protein [Prochlorococcus sp. MIT 1300]|uniref:energy-coupling factor transporter transmembrane component T family protein n=1 Tax=Prochlorococcus sp. MIT 1300 TaxID=3096218 RepID=UPI002A759E40|nr:CbiQ family ECF transporter T component [Prochlorococcus sp. MIT 1300]
MDWLRQVPIGQYVVGTPSWLRNIDPRLKIAWVLMFLVTPVLAGVIWRVFLAITLLVITFCSGVSVRVWLRPLGWLLVLAISVGIFALFLPSGEPSAVLPLRSPVEVSGVVLQSPSWELVRIGPLQWKTFSLGPLVLNRYSIALAIKTSTLIFTLAHSVNLMLITTSPEDVMWSFNWFLTPLGLIGFPIKRLSFQLLLALRFLPLVQEELQNLLRALASRAVSLRQLGIKSSLALILSVGERLLNNILLRAEQGADAFLARGGVGIPISYFKPRTIAGGGMRWLNLWCGCLLVFVLSLRGKYGAL